MAALAAVPAMCGTRGFLSSIAKIAPAADPIPAAKYSGHRLRSPCPLSSYCQVAAVTVLLHTCCKCLREKSFPPAVCQRAAGALEWHGV
jgi:hypothetical protein